MENKKKGDGIKKRANVFCRRPVSGERINMAMREIALKLDHPM